VFSVGPGSAAAPAPARDRKLQPHEQPGSPTFAEREKQKLILCLALAAITLVFYNPVAHDGFIHFDDVSYILNNPAVKAGLTWSTVKWSFTTFASGNWHPLTWLSHALDCQLFGLNPVGHHYVSLLFHAANVVLLFLILEEATALAWPSLIVATIFALHPVNVESVAWAAERKNVLSMFFFLLAMLVYGRYARKGGIPRYLAVNACFVLGMLSKSQIITLPFVLLLWDYWPLRRMFAEKSGFSQTREKLCVPRSLRYLIWEKIPLFAVALVGSLVAMKAQRSADAVRTLEEISLKARLENALVSYANYLRLLVWPRHLAPMYPHPPNGIPLWQIGVSAAVLVTLTGLALRYGLGSTNFQRSQYHRRGYLIVGWLWFLGVLVPMIGIVQVGEQSMADRYAYIPMIGIFIGIVWTAWEITEEKAISKIWVAVPALVFAATLGLLTYHQLGYWRDGETLWRYTLSVTEANYMAHDELALELDKEGRIEDAIPEFLKAESLHKYPLSQVFNIGLYLQRHGHIPEAMRMYEKVVAKTNDPRFRSMAFSQMGAANAQLKDYDQAKAYYHRALEADATNPSALVGSALLAERDGDSDQATEQLGLSTKLKPDDVTLLLLADNLDRSGRSQEAQAARGTAEQLSPDIAQARLNAARIEIFFGLPRAQSFALTQ